MDVDPANLEVRNNEAASRYEADIEGQKAFAVYQKDGDEITFTHTEVPSALEGQGVGSRLAQVALDDAKEQGLSVVPACPFIAAYIEEHPEYQELVSS